MMPTNEYRIGALWRPDKQSDNGPVAKGSIEIHGEKIKIVVWRNRWKKEGERTPDLYIDIDRPKETAEPPAKPAGDLGFGTQPPPSGPFGRSPAQPSGKPEEFVDEIPF
jgi:hypothetical protein